MFTYDLKLFASYANYTISQTIHITKLIFYHKHIFSSKKKKYQIPQHTIFHRQNLHPGSQHEFSQTINYFSVLSRNSQNEPIAANTNNQIYTHILAQNALLDPLKRAILARRPSFRCPDIRRATRSRQNVPKLDTLSSDQAFLEWNSPFPFPGTTIINRHGYKSRYDVGKSARLRAN